MNNREQSEITLMLQAIDFIEAHLQEDITVADMAESVSFSLFHFSRTFSRVTRHTPYDYLMRRRLCAATRQLLESEQKIIEIAFDYQFNAPETFSRAFKRVFHLQPRQARRQGCIDPRLLMVKPTHEYLEFLNDGVSLIPAAVKRPAQTIVGIAAQISSRDADDEVWKLWDLMGQEMRSSALADGNRTYLGVVVLPNVPTSPVTYLAGTVLEEGEDVPLSFLQKRIPVMAAASFELPQRLHAASFTRQYTYHTWWPKASAAPLPQLEIEHFPELSSRQQAAANAAIPDSLYLPIAFD